MHCILSQHADDNKASKCLLIDKVDSSFKCISAH